MKVSPISFLTLLLCLMAGMASCVQEIDDVCPVSPEEGVTLTAICNRMLPQTMLTRAGELTPKDAEEKKINTLHLFFFDTDGNFLQPHNNNTTGAYYRIEVKEGQQASLTIPEDAFVDQGALTNVQVYAVANIYGNKFRTEQWTPEGDIVYGDKNDPTKKVTITKLSNLQNWLYRPEPRKDISKLPEPGMPMVGHTTGVDLSRQNQTIQIKMQALMARVDIMVKLDANQTNHDRSLPSLQLVEYGVRNMPYFVPFTPPAVDESGKPTEVTEIPEVPSEEENPFIARERTVKYEGRILHDQQTAETFSYYTYENVQIPTGEPAYPAGVDPDDETVTQRWKRTIADKNASAVVLKGTYTTHQGLTYTADFNIYMGNNTYNNFEVRRNRCYKNNITICGLDYVRNSDPNVYTFDGRVNVVTDNPLYLSIVNERKLDAHWNIVPMDLYFLRRESGITDLESYVDVSLVNPNTGEAPDWIRMEMVDSLTMLSGKKEEGFIIGGNFEAGTGAREYFYTNLVTETLKDNTKYRVSGPEHRSRSRIYFYVDENASTHDRSATVYITYNNKEGDKRERTLELDQRGLLLVNGTSSSGTPFYIEYYEEYIDHRDPLDKHEQENTYYTGLPWAREGAPLANRTVIGRSEEIFYGWTPFNPCNVYETDEAIRMNNYIFESVNGVTSMDVMKTYPDNIPPSAFHYCRAKNRRNLDGTYESHWYLPGIRELESAITTYYGTFEEFQENYYWSSATAKDPNSYVFPRDREFENPDRARATMYYPDGGGNTWVQSGSKGNADNYTGQGNDKKGGNHGTYNSGRALKTVSFRIRACRTAEGVQ